MTKFEYINKNIDLIKYLIKAGIVSTTFLNNWHIYSRYDYYLKLGNSKAVSSIWIEDEFKLSRMGFFRIRKIMEDQI